MAHPGRIRYHLKEMVGIWPIGSGYRPSGRTINYRRGPWGGPWGALGRGLGSGDGGGGDPGLWSLLPYRGPYREAYCPIHNCLIVDPIVKHVQRSCNEGAMKVPG